MKTEEMLDIISEAESFIDRHSEPWYRSGQELLARVRELQAALAAPAAEAPADVLEIVAKYVGRTSRIYGYIRDDLYARQSRAPENRIATLSAEAPADAHALIAEIREAAYIDSHKVADWIARAANMAEAPAERGYEAGFHAGMRFEANNRLLAVALIDLAEGLTDEAIGQLAFRAGLDVRKEDDDNEPTEDWRWPDADGCGGLEGFDQLRKFANLIALAAFAEGEE